MFLVLHVPVGDFGLWPLLSGAFCFMAVSDCGYFGFWPFRLVTVSACGCFGLWPFQLWTFRVFIVKGNFLFQFNNTNFEILITPYSGYPRYWPKQLRRVSSISMRNHGLSKCYQSGVRYKVQCISFESKLCLSNNSCLMAVGQIEYILKISISSMV